MGFDGFFFFLVSNLVGFLFGLIVFDLRASILKILWRLGD